MGRQVILPWKAVLRDLGVQKEAQNQTRIQDRAQTRTRHQDQCQCPGYKGKELGQRHYHLGPSQSIQCRAHHRKKIFVKIVMDNLSPRIRRRATKSRSKQLEGKNPLYVCHFGVQCFLLVGQAYRHPQKLKWVAKDLGDKNLLSLF